MIPHTTGGPLVETDDRNEITATQRVDTRSWVDELPLLAGINSAVSAVLSVDGVHVETLTIVVGPWEQPATAPRPSTLLGITASAKLS